MSLGYRAIVLFAILALPGLMLGCAGAGANPAAKGLGARAVADEFIRTSPELHARTGAVYKFGSTGGVGSLTENNTLYQKLGIPARTTAHRAYLVDAKNGRFVVSVTVAGRPGKLRVERWDAMAMK